MKKLEMNNKGASLLELLAIIVLSSIVLTTTSNILRQNVRQNAMNQEKLMQMAVANSTLNYVTTIEFDAIKEHLYPNPETFTIDQTKAYYLEFNDNLCLSLTSDANLCYSILKPHINNKMYNPFVMIIPFDRYQIIENIIVEANVDDDYPIFNQHLADILENRLSIENINPQPNDTIFRVVIVIPSTIHQRNDFLLEGVITNHAVKSEGSHEAIIE